jgi:hypothetical protein
MFLLHEPEPLNEVELLTDDYRKIAICESSLNPRAVSRTGKYRGLFQFDQRSWEWVGGSPEITPDQASVSEQYKRARLLVSRQGFKRAFPQCAYITGVVK